MLLAIGCLLLLVLLSGISGDKRNGFSRQWLTITIRKQSSQQWTLLPERLFGDNKALYMSESTHQRIYRLDDWLHITDTIYLSVDKQLKPPVGFYADTSIIYIHEYNSGRLFFKALHATTFDSLQVSTGPFVKSLQLSDSVVVIRSFDAGSFHPIFMRINTRSGEKRKSELLSEKGDAGFSSDGILCADAGKELLFYIPYFENGIYCMDSDMQLRYKRPTIDTVFNSSIQVTSNGVGERQKLYASAPRIKVNKRAFANDRLLFIESDLLADNEEKDTFRQHPVLDTYHLENGKYAGSFYLPVDKRQVLSYHIKGQQIYVLLKEQLISYTMEL
ncbi:hypothetical protein KTO58_01435 [Chitinophaga pendula]|uniref:hypothetical protein n=1 Tax=Chitinophaga TaxID=79328 RepID=UPI000BB096FA|nr:MULTISPECIES: hypothetical protein [Chitinophaga]ASZ14474.1 hypothetical protein CK934_27785 [Chitinophaga sp. MD30]UCJ07869.1 hypothetical protein KTO58_01435 [Chitinophaga pendula]